MKYTPTYSHIQLKRGTTARWNERNPILLAGEVGLEIIENQSSPNTYKVKIGDGINTWSQLPYYGDTQSISSLTASQISADGTLHAAGSGTSTLSSTNPPLMVGAQSSTNVAFSNDAIQARSGGAASTLNVQSYGGTTYFGSNNASNNSNVTINGSLSLVSGATTNATINSLGYISMPRQPAFCVRGATSTTGGTLRTVIFNGTTDFNVGTSYNTNTGRFTAPVAGKYFFEFHIFATSGFRQYSFIAKNGAYMQEYTQEQPTGGTGQGFASLDGKLVMSLAQNDYVTVLSTATIYSTSSVMCSFSGYLIG